MGCLPSEVEAIPATDYDLLLRYWEEEPFGAWRDNAHAAIIAREVRKLGTKRGRRVPMDDFMLLHPEKRREGNVRAFVAALRAMAGGKPVSTPSKRPPSGRRKVEKPVEPKKAKKPKPAEQARRNRRRR